MCQPTQCETGAAKGGGFSSGGAAVKFKDTAGDGQTQAIATGSAVA